MHESIPGIETERLELRPFTIDDAPQVHRLLAPPDVARTTLNLPYPYPPGAAETWIATHAEQACVGDNLHWAIARKQDDVLMGAIRLGIAVRHARGSLGYWLGVPFWNQGYMSEAALAVTNHALGTLSLHRVEAMCFPRNTASSRVMEKAGLQFEGVLWGYFRKGEVFEDVAIYARVVPVQGRA
ncbi:MAG: GNAT family N-acetyltransferase [Thermomicrobiales bacterium]